MVVIYDEVHSTTNGLDEYFEFDSLFNNTDDGNYYVMCGLVEDWKGLHIVNSDKVYSSIRDCITGNLNCKGEIIVHEGKYGKLLVDVYHHDGTDCLEIRELSNLGEELYFGRDYSVKSVLDRYGTTRNVKFLKRYGDV